MRLALRYVKAWYMKIYESFVIGHNLWLALNIELLVEKSFLKETKDRKR